MTKESDLCCSAFSSETYPNPFLLSFILGQEVWHNKVEENTLVLHQNDKFWLVGVASIFLP